ncbi:serine protease [Streptomyces sp. HNM0645]|uniref:serine protease n=1 Tax=Streptomyces sp. HNM0645 TaxID=2782343 RepID=UPI0024B6507F|nr:serine protease [Streptomyces sp. HNM0645]MDI9888597.1 serine protease [Streptomyces sp. HNM0645]
MAEPEMHTDEEDAETLLVSAIVRVKGPDGTIGGAGFLIAPDLALTCAHVVLDALGLKREGTVKIGRKVTLDQPLAGNGGEWTAVVEHWKPIRGDETGDIAVLRLPDTIPGARPLPLLDARDVWNHNARAMGFTDDNLNGIWHSGRLRGRVGGGWVQLSRDDGEAVRVKGGFSGSPVWDNRLRAVVGMMVAAQPVREAQQAFVLRTSTLLDEVPALDPVVSPPTPFRGLAVFQEGDAGVFFGRDADIARVVTALDRGAPSVTVYGPSGCGKSSLVMAGVVPKVRRSGREILKLNAGHFESLRAELATQLYEIVRSLRYGEPRIASAGEIESCLTKLGLADTARRALGPEVDELLVILDQAEALLDPSKDVAGEAADLLFPEGRQSGVRVLLTLRADYMDAALKHARLGLALNRGVTVPLAPMSREQLAKVISEPVRRIPAVDYDPGLERRILDDAGGEPGVLPLLGFVLTQLWDKKNEGRLQAATYEEIKGVSGALKRHAEEAWEACVKPKKEEKNKSKEKDEGEEKKQREHEMQALRLLTGLVRFLPGGEAPLRRMLPRKEAGEKQWRIAESLAEQRLLVLQGGSGKPESVELAHEALITAWPTLAQQVQDNRDFLAGRAELQHDLDRWRRADESSDLLPSPHELQSLQSRLAKHKDQLDQEERDFLKLTERHHRTRRNRLRAAWIAAALVLALIVGLGTFLVYQSKVSSEREAQGRSRSLASLSEELTKRDSGLAALVAMAAYDISPTQEARDVLLRRYDQYKNDSWVLTGTESPVDEVATSADGAVTLVTTDVGGLASELGSAVLFVRGTAGRVQRVYLRLAEQAFYPLVSRDGRRVAYLSSANDGTLVWYDVDREAEEPEQILGPAHSIRSSDFNGFPVFGQQLGVADFSPDAREVVTVVNGRARLWNLATRRGRGLPDGVPLLEKVWFGPDENTLVVQPKYGRETDGDSSVMAVDILTGKTRELAAGVQTSMRPRLALSGDGGVLAFCRRGPGSDDRPVYRAVRVADGRVLTRYQPGKLGSDSCKGIAIDRTGEHFAAQDTGSSWVLVDTRPGKGVQEADGPSEVSDLDALRLVGDRREPTLVTWDETAVTGRPLIPGTIDADSYPVLLGRGDKMVLRMGANGDRMGIARMDVDGDTTIVKEVKRPPRDTSTDAAQDAPEVKVNGAQTFVADVVGRNKIRVWAIPSLREVAEITTVMPPAGTATTSDPVEFLFGPGDELVTVSGSRIEYWDARTGQRLAKTVDVRSLGLTKEDPPEFSLDRYPKPGYVQVMIKGSPVLHAVNLRTGRENKALGIKFPREVDIVSLDDSGRYAAVKTKGTMVELWSIRPGRPPERVLGPFGPLQSYGRYRAGFLGDSSEFLLANGNSIRFQDAVDPGNAESYDFAEDQEFLAASQDGRTLLRLTDDTHVDLLHLEPELWKDQLCDILGRDVTRDERRGLPNWLPRNICPN